MPLPDLSQVVYAPLPGQQLVSIAFRARADGALRQPFDVDDGTLGRVEVTQNGILWNSPKAKNWDAFPVEHILLKAVKGG